MKRPLLTTLLVIAAPVTTQTATASVIRYPFLKLKSILAVAAFTLVTVGSAHSAVITVGSQAAFSALGTIVQNTNWDSYGTGWTYPGNNFVVGDLTFVQGGQNLIGGIADYGMARALFTDDYVRGTTAFAANTYDLFAFNAGNFFGGASTANFSVTTNLGNYSFTENVSSYAYGGSLTFIGFEAGPGEWFSSVAWSGSGATGITDIQLGLKTSVPEPASLALLGLGLAGLGFSRRRKAKA